MEFPIKQVMKCKVLEESLKMAKDAGNWDGGSLETLQEIYDEAVSDLMKAHDEYKEWKEQNEASEFVF